MENVQLQFQGDFIDRLAEEDVVPQRIVDGYFNATAMCAASQKLIADYLRLSTTKAFLHDFKGDKGIGNWESKSLLNDDACCFSFY